MAPKNGKTSAAGRCGWIKPSRKGEFLKPDNDFWYVEILATMHKNPGCIGFHLRGAYQRNKARRRGLLDEMKNPDTEHVKIITAANRKNQ